MHAAARYILFGFGINVAYKPCHCAIVLTTNLKVTILSAVVSASAYLKSISCWALATSWWEASISKAHFLQHYAHVRRARRAKVGRRNVKISRPIVRMQSGLVVFV